MNINDIIKKITPLGKLFTTHLKKLFKHFITCGYEEDDLSNVNFWGEAREFVASFCIGHIILWVTVIFIFVMLIWAYFAEVEEITRAPGVAILSSKPQYIQSLEGGIIKKILVEEGQAVNKDQILVQLDETQFSSAFTEAEARKVTYEIRVLRVQAELSDSPFVVPKEIEKNYPDIVQSAKELYESRKNEMKNLYSIKNLVTKELTAMEPLLKRGSVAEVEVLRLQQRLLEIEAGINRLRNEDLQELNVARAESERLEKSNISLEDRLARANLRSPVKGIVKEIHVTTKGGVVGPGVPIMEIAPIEDTLLIEARVSPQDIGFLRVGQRALVKISAYDFSIYGGLSGKLEYISAGTNVDSRGNSFYEIRVRTDKNAIESKGKFLPIIPGMFVSVEIITGKKSVLSYLLKPILQTTSEALRER